MALTRAQLLMGDDGQGTVLTGQAQGVRPGGPGITIATDGIISVNSQTVVGLMKLGQTPTAAANAYNQYDWPTGAPSPGQQLTAITVGGVTTLGWSDPDGIPWTAKGQLLVGQPLGAQVILNAGTDTSFLMADSTTTSGLIYSNSSTSAAQMPAGGTGARPNPATRGQLRYNIDTNQFEFATGPTSWVNVVSTPGPVPPTIVSSITAGAGLLGGTITSTGTISMPNVGPGGSYSNANIILDAQGRVTAASNGLTSVNVSGGGTGLTFVGGPITTSGTITMGGVLGIGNGGTGGTTQPAAINNLLPGQGGNNTKVLTTDGSNVSWQPGGGGATAVQAWVSFNGMGGAAILDSLDISSVTYLGTGYYQVNFTTPRPNSSYCLASSVTDSTTPGSAVNIAWVEVGSRSPSSFILRTAQAASGPADSTDVCVMLTDN